MEQAVTIDQIELMKHFIGLDRKGPRRGKYEAYRNYFADSDNSYDTEDLKHLVGIGYATRRKHTDAGLVWYHLTDDGIEFIGKVVGCKITMQR